jgi:hypothetical protein
MPLGNLPVALSCGLHPLLALRAFFRRQVPPTLVQRQRQAALLFVAQAGVNLDRYVIQADFGGGSAEQREIPFPASRGHIRRGEHGVY